MRIKSCNERDQKILPTVFESILSGLWTRYLDDTTIRTMSVSRVFPDILFTDSRKNAIDINYDEYVFLKTKFLPPS